MAEKNYAVVMKCERDIIFPPYDAHYSEKSGWILNRNKATRFTSTDSEALRFRLLKEHANPITIEFVGGDFR